MTCCSRAPGRQSVEWDEIAVIDGLNSPVPDGEPGELITRGPYRFAATTTPPDVNAQAFTDDGFYRMGDIVRKRARYVYTEGRRKDLINRGGHRSAVTRWKT